MPLGPNTEMNVSGDSDAVFYGHLAQVTVSGQGSFSYLVTPQMAMTQRAIDDGTQIMRILNNTYTSSSSGMGAGGATGGGAGGSSNGTSSASGAMPSSTGSSGSSNSTGSAAGGMGGTSTASTDGTISIDQFASDADVCLVFINAYSGEGADRSALRDDEQDGYESFFVCLKTLTDALVVLCFPWLPTATTPLSSSMQPDLV